MRFQIWLTLLVPSEPRQSFADKIQGITDKLQSLSYSKSHHSAGGGAGAGDSSNGSCSEPKSKSGACSVHPMVTVTPSPLAGMLLQSSSARSTDSSPSHSHSHSHSQMSRNSSRKSNNSVNCKLDGEFYIRTYSMYRLNSIMHFNSLRFKTPCSQILLFGSVDVKSATERCRLLFIAVGSWPTRRQTRV